MGRTLIHKMAWVAILVFYKLSRDRGLAFKCHPLWSSEVWAYVCFIMRWDDSSGSKTMLMDLWRSQAVFASLCKIYKCIPSEKLTFRLCSWPIVLLMLLCLDWERFACSRCLWSPPSRQSNCCSRRGSLEQILHYSLWEQAAVTDVEGVFHVS